MLIYYKIAQLKRDGSALCVCKTTPPPSRLSFIVMLMDNCLPPRNDHHNCLLLTNNVPVNDVTMGLD